MSQRGPFGKTEALTRANLKTMQPDPHDVAASYRRGEAAAEDLHRLARVLCGPESPYLQAAWQALQGRLHAQDAYVRNRIGTSELFEEPK